MLLHASLIEEETSRRRKILATNGNQTGHHDGALEVMIKERKATALFVAR